MYERRDVIKSKEAIKSAFLRACWSKDIRKITVTEIINTANVSRGTFYAHFDDIYDLREKIENEIIELIFSNACSKDIQDIIQNPLPVVSSIFLSFYENADTIRKLMGKQKDYSFFFKCEQRLLNILAQSDDYFSDDLKRRVIDNCVTGIIIKNCYNFIINDENNDQVKKAAELVSEFIYKAVH